MRKYFAAILAVALVVVALSIAYTKLYIKRDVPILVERTQVATSTAIVQADIVSYEAVCSGIIYDIDQNSGNYLVTLPMQSDIQTGIDAGKKYMSVNLYNASTKQTSVFNFDLTNHISACFAEDATGVYYISSDARQRKELMYTTIDNSKTISIAGGDEKISTGICRVGENIVYGTQDGKIVLANAAGEKKELFALNEQTAIKKVCFFPTSQWAIVLVENQKTKQTPLYVIDITNKNMKNIDLNAEDFDANEENALIVYITKSESGNQIYSYDIRKNRKTYLKSGLVENVVLSPSGEKVAYFERTKDGASTVHIGLVDLTNGIANIRLVTDVRLSNRKIVWSGENIILFSEHRSLTTKSETGESLEYVVQKCEYML